MPYLVAALLALGLLAGLFTPAMDIDAAQYAAIAMEMLDRGQWLEITERGLPYLDKPPLVFWTAAASYAVFGVSDWAYKLPSLLALGVAIWSTGRLAGTLSGDDDTARLARWTLGGSLAALLMVADPRTDTLLMAGVAFATWQGAAYLRGGRPAHLAWCAVGIGVGMLAKGPLGLVAPAAALGVDVLVHRRWARLRTPWLLLVPLLVALLLAPMCWGLWTQYGARGLSFYFWTQSFGRVTGSNVWRNDAGPLFFTHTFLWTFLPWAPLVVWRLWRGVRAATRGTGAWRDEALASGAFVLLFVAISASRYKLPHYCYVLLPFAAVLAARELRETAGAEARGWPRVILAQAGLLPPLALGLSAWAFGPLPWYGWGLVAVALGMGWWVRHAEAPWRTAYRAAIALGAAGVLLNGVAGPRLFAYQTETTAGRLVRAAGVPPGAFVAVGHHRPSLDFAARRIVPDLAGVGDVVGPLAVHRDGLWVYARAAQGDSLARLAARAETVATFAKFGVSRLNGRFLNPATRDATTEAWVLLRLVGP
jgi:4-amino-4-deoxy-L-arabinose transferase-like glycosyltransferase